MLYLRYRYKYFNIVILDLCSGVARRVHLNVKVRNLREIRHFPLGVKKILKKSGSKIVGGYSA